MTGQKSVLIFSAALGALLSGCGQSEPQSGAPPATAAAPPAPYEEELRLQLETR